MSDFDEFFDDEGNLKSTAWKKEEEAKQRKQQALQEEAEKKRKIKELKRRKLMDDSQDKFFAEHERKQKERSIKEEWMELPRWIKSMPRTSLSEPPTEGSWNIMRYKMTGKVVLTEAEEQRRKKMLSRVKMAIDSHKKIAQKIPLDSNAYIPVVGFSDDGYVGSTTLTRCIMQALNDSRPVIDNLTAVDFGGKDSDFSAWFTHGNEQYVFLKNVMDWINSKDTPFDRGMFPTVSGSNQSFISNRSGGKSRKEITIDTVAQLYSSLDTGRGFIIGDHDIREPQGVLAGITLASTPIFVVPIEKKAAQTISRMLNILENSVSPQRFEDIKSRAVLVTNCTSPELSDPKAREIVNKFLYSVAQECDLNTERIVNIPYDPGLSVQPLKWNKVSFSTQHMVRTICGFIVDDVAQDYGM